MAHKKVKVLVVEPNSLLALGLETVLNQNDRFNTEVADCRDTEELMNTVTLVQPDVLIINPIVSGIRIDSTLANKVDGSVVAFLYSNMRTLPIIGYKHSLIEDAQPKEIIELMDEVLEDGNTSEQVDNEKALSPREIDVIILVAKGMTNKEIAYYLSLSIHTVITHRRNIARKLDIHSVSGLTIYAIMNNLVTLEETNMK